MASPFHALELAELWEGLGRTRLRQHVNPLRLEHQAVLAPMDWAQVFADPCKPLVVDLGCGPGRFMLLMHHLQPAPYQGANFLGLEIRKPLVERANEWAERLGCREEVHFMPTNATVNVTHLLSSYPGPIMLVCVQFPDPHFKRRHWKRRILQPGMVQELAAMLNSQGKLFLQSDVEPAVAALRDVVEEHAGHLLCVDPAHQQQPTFPATTATEPATPDAQLAPQGLQQASPSGPPQPPQLGAPVEPDSRSAALPTHHASTEHGGPAGGSVSEDPEVPEGDRGTGGRQAAQPAAGQAAWAGPASGLAGAALAAATAAGMGTGDCEEAVSDDGEDGSAGLSPEPQPKFESQWQASGWLRDNPLGVPTEREHYVMQQGRPVFRVLLCRRSDVQA